MRKEIKRLTAAVLALTIIGGTLPTVSSLQDYSLTASAEYVYGDGHLEAAEVTVDDCVYAVYADHAVLTKGSTKTRVTVPAEVSGVPVTEIGKDAFLSSSYLLTITIPDSVTEISYNAFYDCANLMKVELGNSVETINNYAFQECPALESINFPASLKTIGSNAFESCTSLTSLEPSEGLTTIGERAFLYSGLKSVKLPSTVESVGGFAFAKCFDLETAEITISDGIIQGRLFSDDQALTSVKVNGKVSDIYENAFEECHSLSSISFERNNTAIGDQAFYDCYALADFDFDGVSSIGYCAFQKTALTDITLPYSVKELSDEAFWNSPLTKVTILNPDCDIYHGNGVFYYNEGLPTIYGYDYSTAYVYAKEFEYPFVSLGEAPEVPPTPTYSLGDVNGDDKVDSTDASAVLGVYAVIATGGTSDWTAEQLHAADVNGDLKIDSSDASDILAYYAYVATGGDMTPEEYFA